MSLVAVESNGVATAATPSFRATADAAGWLRQQRAQLEGLRISRGAIRLRGMPFETPEQFAVLRDEIIRTPANYVEKATPRSAFGANVFSSTDVPPPRTIRLHNENSYALRFPGVLVFGCLIAAQSGGATTLGDIRRLGAMLSSETRESFAQRGWCLIRNYWGHLGLSWQQAFDTDDRQDVEEYAAANDMTLEWIDDRLRTSQVRSAFLAHPITHEELWFNHLAFWNKWTLARDVRELLAQECGEDLPYETLYGDGSAVPRSVIDEINHAYDAVTVSEPWRGGDILIIDNLAMAHGREPFEGSRNIVVGMGNPIDRAACAGGYIL